MDLSAFDLKGKVALITGGAHGIGFSIAVGMAQCGATVCFNCSNEGSLEKGIAAYKEAGVEAHGYVSSLSTPVLISGPFVSRSVAIGLLISSLTLLTNAKRPACSSWSPCEKLNLAISIPLSASCLISSLSLVLGPIVHITLVFFIITSK